MAHRRHRTSELLAEEAAQLFTPPPSPLPTPPPRLSRLLLLLPLLGLLTIGVVNWVTHGAPLALLTSVFTASSRRTQALPSALPFTVNGECGLGRLLACRSGDCCSQYGWCGTSSAYCGAGCQGAPWGTCTTPPANTTTSSSSPTPSPTTSASCSCVQTSASQSWTPTPTASITPTPVSQSLTPTPSVTTPLVASQSPTPTPSTLRVTASQSSTPPPTLSPTPSRSPTPTPSASRSASRTLPVKAASTTALPSLGPTLGPYSRFPAGTIVSTCSQPGVVALTFDDGPYTATETVLTVLAQYNATATFALNGNNWDCIYDADKSALVRREVAGGHQIVSHSWSHPDLATLTPAAIALQISLMDTALSKIVGVVPAFFRPPFGSYNTAVKTALLSADKVMALWDQDSNDWRVTGTPSFLAGVKAAYNAIPAGASPIVLNHDTVPETGTLLLPWVLGTWLPSRGLRAVTLGECLGLPSPAQWYSAVSAPQAPDASWTCLGKPLPGKG